MSFFDRFKPPGAADEQSDCQHCGETFHYEALDDNGLCQDCRPEEEDEEEGL
jgi:hypothetical protein